jgi:hypothetical protein
MNIGDFVRLTRIPPKLAELQDTETHRLFELSLGRPFPIAAFNVPAGFPIRMVELHVDEVLGKAACIHSIWVEEDCLEVAGPTE